LDARLTTLLCKEIIVAKSKEVKPQSNLAESSREGSGLQKKNLLFLPTMMTNSYYEITMCILSLS
jgi:hypothetical protein